MIGIADNRTGRDRPRGGRAGVSTAAERARAVQQRDRKPSIPTEISRDVAMEKPSKPRMV